MAQVAQRPAGDGPCFCHPDGSTWTFGIRWDSAFTAASPARFRVPLPDRSGMSSSPPLSLLTRLATCWPPVEPLPGLLVGMFALLALLVAVQPDASPGIWRARPRRVGHFLHRHFPGSLLFSAVYGESLQLLFCLPWLCAYFTRRAWWLPAGVCAGCWRLQRGSPACCSVAGMLLEWASAGGLTWRNFYRRQGGWGCDPARGCWPCWPQLIAPGIAAAHALLQ